MLSRSFVALPLALVTAGCAASVNPMSDAALDRPAPSDVLSDALRPDVSQVDASQPDGAMCSIPAVRELRVPRVTREGEPIPVAVLSAGAGCGCSPALTVSESALQLAACGCSNQLPCVDLGYVANGIAPSRPAGTNALFTAGAQRSPHDSVARDERCAGGRTSIDRVRVVQDEALRGPRRFVWLEITGTSLRCSSDPWALVTVSAGSPRVVSVEDCNNSDCDGPTGARPFRVWRSLGELAPGTYSLFYSPGISQEFTVQ